MEYLEIPCNLCGSKDAELFARGPDFEYRCSEDDFTVVKCRNCGLVYLNPRPGPSELDVIYPENYIPYRFDEYLSGFVNRMRMFVQRSKVGALKKYAGADASIFDVGCGGGLFLESLRSSGPGSWKLTGIDISEKAVEKIKAKGFNGISGRFETLEIESDSVDVIVLNQVIEHLDDPAAVIEKSRKILKKGGLIFIETPSLEGWDAALFKSRHWGGYHFPRHWTFFTLETLGKLLEQKGFSAIEKTWLLSPNFWAQSFHHALVDRGVSQRIAGNSDCRNPIILAICSFTDIIQRLFGHTSNMRIVGKKT